MGKLLKLATFSVLLTGSVTGFAQSRSRRPFPKPTMLCHSVDGNFKLFIYPNLALIRVYDKGQKTFSHSIRGLKFKVTKSVVYAHNQGAEADLPKGIIFAANMTIPKTNAYSIDDRAKTRTHYTCSFTK